MADFEMPGIAFNHSHANQPSIRLEGLSLGRTVLIIQQSDDAVPNESRQRGEVWIDFDLRRMMIGLGDGVVEQITDVSQLPDGMLVSHHGEDLIPICIKRCDRG